jgi:hypothetical protein
MTTAHLCFVSFVSQPLLQICICSSFEEDLPVEIVSFPGLLCQFSSFFMFLENMCFMCASSLHCLMGELFWGSTNWRDKESDFRLAEHVDFSNTRDWSLYSNGDWHYAWFSNLQGEQGLSLLATCCLQENALTMMRWDFARFKFLQEHFLPTPKSLQENTLRGPGKREIYWWFWFFCCGRHFLVEWQIDEWSITGHVWMAWLAGSWDGAEV